MVLVFLLLMFPYDGLQTRLIYTLSGFFPFQLRAMGTYEVVPPLGIAWSDVKMQGLDRLSMPWRRMELVLDSVSALKGKPQLKLTMESYAGLSTSSGKIHAELLLNSFSTDAAAEASGSIEQIDLSRIEGAKITRGLLNGTFSHHWDKFSGAETFIRGEGKWDIDIADLNLENSLLAPIFHLEMRSAKVDIMLYCASGICTIQAIKAEGLNQKLSGSGTLQLRMPIEESVLQATVWLSTGDSVRSEIKDNNQSGMGPLKMNITGPLARVAVGL